MLYKHLPNSTRALPAAEIDEVLAECVDVETTGSVKETTR